MLAEATCIFRCPGRPAALDAAGLWRERWNAIDPIAVAYIRLILLSWQHECHIAYQEVINEATRQ